jgi:hypothetical protein
MLKIYFIIPTEIALGHHLFRSHQWETGAASQVSSNYSSGKRGSPTSKAKLH